MSSCTHFPSSSNRPVVSFCLVLYVFLISSVLSIGRFISVLFLLGLCRVFLVTLVDPCIFAWMGKTRTAGPCCSSQGARGPSRTGCLSDYGGGGSPFVYLLGFLFMKCRLAAGPEDFTCFFPNSFVYRVLLMVKQGPLQLPPMGVRRLLSRCARLLSRCACLS